MRPSTTDLGVSELHGIRSMERERGGGETEEAYCVWGSETAAVTEITVPAKEEDKGKKGWLAP